MEKYNMLNHENSLLQHVKYACAQLQLEEKFSEYDKQIVNKGLGINWQSSSTYIEAKKALDASMNIKVSHKTSALFKSVMLVLDEMLPLFLKLNDTDIPENISTLFDAQNLLDRLRHHFLIEMLYLEQNPDKNAIYTKKIITNSDELFQSAKKQNIELKDIWFQYLENAVDKVLQKELNRPDVSDITKHIILSGNKEKLEELNNKLKLDKKDFLHNLSDAVIFTRKQLEEDFYKYSGLVTPDIMNRFIPQINQIIRLIYGYFCQEHGLQNAFGNERKLPTDTNNDAEDHEREISDDLEDTL